MPDTTTEPVPFRLRLPDGTETGDLADTEAAQLIARHPTAVLISHVGDTDEAHRAQRVHQAACDIRRYAVEDTQRLAQQRDDALADLVTARIQEAQARTDRDEARAAATQWERIAKDAIVEVERLRAGRR